MKFLLGLVVALAITIAWQTSVLSQEKATTAHTSSSMERMQQENEAAGRVPYEGDCE